MPKNSASGKDRAPSPETRVYVVYDARANYDVDAASVLFSAGTLAEARQMSQVCGPECVIISYRLVEGVATDPRREPGAP